MANPKTVKTNKISPIYTIFESYFKETPMLTLPTKQKLVI